VRRAALVDELLKEGASHVLVTENNPDLIKEIIKAAGGVGVDAIFDCVVGELAGKVRTSLPSGRCFVADLFCFFFCRADLRHPEAWKADDCVRRHGWHRVEHFSD